jgi:hypothetical protein
MMLNDTETSEYAYQKGDARLIPALASGKSQEEAAASAALSRATVVRRLNDPAFRAEVRRVQSEMVEKVTGLLAEGAAEGARKLKELLSAESESVQLGAVRSLLDFSLRLREEAAAEELRQRIESLEELLKTKR